MGLTETVEKGLRVAIVAVGVIGVKRRNPGAIANAVVSLAATYLPGVVERRHSVALRPWQRLYVDTAMLTHAVGMLGPYDDVWWWDHLTHAHSATILGGIIHADARRRGRDPRPRVLAGAFAAGALWEVVEYLTHVASRRIGLEPVLVSYGETDTILDVVFNLVGALVVIAFGDHLLGNLVRREEPAERRGDDRSCRVSEET